jgi:hypothetical protein
MHLLAFGNDKVELLKDVYSVEVFQILEQIIMCNHGVEDPEHVLYHVDKSNNGQDLDPGVDKILVDGIIIIVHVDKDVGGYVVAVVQAQEGEELLEGAELTNHKRAKKN